MSAPVSTISAKTYDFSKELEFLNLCERVKREERHCWYFNGRRESVGEHCWRLGLMVLRYGPQLNEPPIDLFKTLKMSTTYLLARALSGDVPVIHQNAQNMSAKGITDRNAMAQMTGILGDANAGEMIELWEEYQAQQSRESRVLKALSKIEAFLAHNESPLNTWEYKEKQMVFGRQYLLDHVDKAGEPLLTALAKKVLADAVEIMRQGGEDVEAIRATVEGPGEGAVKEQHH